MKVFFLSVSLTRWTRYDTKTTTIHLRRLDPFTATTSSLITTGAGIVGSAVDIVAKPIQAYSRPKTPLPSSDVAQPKADQPDPDSAIWGRPAALSLPPPSDGRRTTSFPPDEAHHSNFTTAVKGSAAGVGGFFAHFTKGMYLDLPLAMTEGMRVAPRLYGGEVYQLGPVEDWKSGAIAAGKNFGHGIVEGLGGLVMSPIRGAETDGAAGAAKGVGVGCLNVGTKFTSGQSRHLFP